MNRQRIRELAEQKYAALLKRESRTSTREAIESAILAALSECLSEEPSEGMVDAGYATDAYYKFVPIELWKVMAAAKLKEINGG